MTAMIEERPTVAPVTAQTTAASSTRAAKAVASMPNEFLSFRLGGEEYGIDILRVQEIRIMSSAEMGLMEAAML